ncbi:hypothetical protein H0E86_21685 [Streptomyces sp. SCSIO-PteL053]|nr:hypothetical protein H0E86_21685 [Streptomyces sp. SCSIO-PteL053]
MTTPGNRAEVLFDAEAGDDFTFGFTDSTFNQSVRLRLIGPDGTQVGSSGSVSGAVSDWEVAEVPLAGRYVLRLEPGTGNIGAVTVTLSHPVEATSPSGAPPRRRGSPGWDRTPSGPSTRRGESR